MPEDKNVLHEVKKMKKPSGIIPILVFSLIISFVCTGIAGASLCT
jgi:hypothetical protein